MKSLGVKKFQSLLLVSSIEMVLTIVALLSDTVIAGHLGRVLGDLNNGPLSAINIVIPIVSSMAFVSYMLSFGVKLFYNKALGEENKEHADEIFGLGLFTAIVTGITVYIIAKSGIELYLDFFKVDDKIRYYFYEYFKYFQFVLLVNPPSVFLNDMVYNDGDEMTANCANVMNIIGNIVLSIMFAFYLRMGMSGIALGTLLKEIFSILILICHFFRKTNSLHVKKYFNFKLLLKFFQYGFAQSGSLLAWGILTFIMNKFVIVFYGIFYLPVLTMAVSLLEFTIIFEGVSSAAFPLLDVYYHEGNYPAMRKVMKAALKISIIEGIIVSLILFIFAEDIAYALGIENPELVKHSVMAIRIISSTMIFPSLGCFFENYYIITDKVFISLWLSFIGNLLFIPLVSYMTCSLTGSINGIWIGFASQYFLSFVACSLILKIFYKDKEGKYPFYLKSEENVKEFDIELSPENIYSVMDDTEKFLQEKGFDRRTINRILFMIEESEMLISEKNQGKNILAEYTIFLKPDKIKVSVRDNGKIFNITEEDAEITSFESYIFSLAAPKMFSQRKYLTVTSLNRNIFYQKVAFTL